MLKLSRIPFEDRPQPRVHDNRLRRAHPG